MDAFEQRYLNLTRWVREYDGWIAIGPDDLSHSLVRVLGLGGMVWESREGTSSIDLALTEADQAVADEIASY